jgi:hypothetical protein
MAEIQKGRAHSGDVQPGKRTSRILFAIWLAQFLIWFAIAPAIAEAIGRREDAGYVQFFMLYSTLVPGLVIGVVGIIVPHRKVWIVALLLNLAHLAIGLGFHPR